MSFWRFTLICVCLLASGAAMAQEPPDTVKYHFPVMTTIGTRITQPLFEVPFSVSTLQKRDIGGGKGVGLDEALSTIPGVLAQSRAGGTDIRLEIRGFGARGAGQRSNAGTSRGVRILTDGFPETEPDGRTSFDLIDLSGAGAIEVMRSNASSVYGNASGGVINVMSNTMFERPYVTFGETFGSFGFRKEAVNAGANVGSGKFYLSLFNANSDGWRYHSGSTQAMINTGLVSAIGERTTLGVYVSATSNLYRMPGALTQAQYDSLAQQADSTLFIKRDERRYNRIGRIGVTASHGFDDNNGLAATLFVQPKVLQRSERNQFREFNRYHLGGSAIYSNRSSFGADAFNIAMVGMDEAYQDGAIQFYRRYDIPSQPFRERGTLRPDGNKREGANNFGTFVQDEISLGEHWRFLLGGRYDNITYNYENYSDPSLVWVKKSFEHFTPKAGATYQFSPTHSVYASLGGGVEVAAGNETDSDPLTPDAPRLINPLLAPIASTTVEAGTKHMVRIGGEKPFADLIYDVALYWLEVRNDIIPYGSNASGTDNGTLFFTAGKTRRMGIEAAATLQFDMGLSLNVALTASDNKYVEYRVDSVHYNLNAAGKFSDYANNKVVGVPDFFATAGVRYAPEMFRGAYIRFMMQNVGKYFVNDANTITVPSYTTLNAGVGVEHLNFAGETFFCSAFFGVNNIADTKYIGSAYLNPNIVNGKPMYIEPGLPRNVVGSVSVGVNL